MKCENCGHDNTNASTVCHLCGGTHNPYLRCPEHGAPLTRGYAVTYGPIHPSWNVPAATMPIMTAQELSDWIVEARLFLSNLDAVNTSQMSPLALERLRQQAAAKRAELAQLEAQLTAAVAKEFKK